MLCTWTKHMLRKQEQIRMFLLAYFCVRLMQVIMCVTENMWYWQILAVSTSLELSVCCSDLQYTKSLHIFTSSFPLISSVSQSILLILSVHSMIYVRVHTSPSLVTRLLTTMPLTWASSRWELLISPILNMRHKVPSLKQMVALRLNISVSALFLGRDNFANIIPTKKGHTTTILNCDHNTFWFEQRSFLLLPHDACKFSVKFLTSIKFYQCNSILYIKNGMLQNMDMIQSQL